MNDFMILDSLYALIKTQEELEKRPESPEIKEMKDKFYKISSIGDSMTRKKSLLTFTDECDTKIEKLKRGGLQND